MKANAARDPNAAKSVMAPAAGKVVEAALLMMQYFGLKGLQVKKLASADFEKVIAVVEFFPGTPEELKECGVLVKDSIAEVLASTGVVRLEIEADESEVKTIVTGYEKMIQMYHAKPAEKPADKPAKKPADKPAEPKAKCGSRCHRKKDKR